MESFCYEKPSAEVGYQARVKKAIITIKRMVETKDEG